MEDLDGETAAGTEMRGAPLEAAALLGASQEYLEGAGGHVDQAERLRQ